VGSVGTRHLKLDAMREEEHADGVVIKLVFIITLDAPDGATKLRGHKGKEVREGGEGVGLLAQRESPKVTVYEVKWAYLDNQPPSDDNVEVESIARKYRMYHLIDGVLY
jgi:hypothetical protein